MIRRNATLQARILGLAASGPVSRTDYGDGRNTGAAGRSAHRARVRLVEMGLLRVSAQTAVRGGQMWELTDAGREVAS